MLPHYITPVIVSGLVSECWRQAHNSTLYFIILVTIYLVMAFGYPLDFSRYCYFSIGTVFVYFNGKFWRTGIVNKKVINEFN